MLNSATLPPVFVKLLRMSAALLGLLLIAILYVALVGVSLDISTMRGKVAATLTQSLGREVRVEGPLQLEISARPKLLVGGLHIANAAGFSGGELASLGQARLGLDLWPLFRLRLKIEELAGSDLRLRLQVNQQGKTNWSLGAPSTPQSQQPPAAEKNIQPAMEMILTRLDIKRVSLEKLNVEFIDAQAQSHFFELQSLLAQLPAGQPFTLTLRGTVEKIYPYQLDFSGGSMAELAQVERPWPIDLKLGFMSSRLTLKGLLAANSGDVALTLSSDNLAEFEQLLQTKLPAVGAAKVSGMVHYAPEKIALDHLSGSLGNTTLNGELSVSYAGARPRLQGELVLPVLDLRPFVTGKPVAQTAPPQSFAEVYRELAQATFNLNQLKNFDADLTLRVGQWLSLPGAVHDAMLQVKLEQGRLVMPLQATVADVNLAGRVSADASVSPARFNVALGTQDSSLGNLAGLLLGMPDVQGHLGRFDLRIAARGDQGSALMQSLEVKFDVAQGNLTYGNAAGSRPVRFSLDKLSVSLPVGKALRGEAQGALLDKKFSATLQGASLTDTLQQADAPIDFVLQAGTAKAEIHALLRAPTDQSGSVIKFDLAAPHSGEIADWLGLRPGADTPIRLHGDFNTDNHSWHLADFYLKLGRSGLSADVMRTTEQGKSLIKLQLLGDLIDLDELQTLQPAAKAQPAVANPTTAVNMIDIPILPNSISLADADLVVRIKHMASQSPFVVRNLRFDGRIRDGMMSESPFAANIADTDFAGTLLVDLRAAQPRAALGLSADALDIGRVLKKLGIAGNIEAAVDHLGLQLDLHSSRLGELLAQSELRAHFEGGQITLNDANTGGKMRIALDQGELKSAAGAPVFLNLIGSLDHAPVAINIQTAKAVDLINPNLPIPFSLNANTSGAVVKLSGDIDRPLVQQDIELALEMSGSRFDNLNTLAHTSLPPWGPWSASGKFHMSSLGYEVSALQLQVGTSQLTGYGKVDTTKVPPRMDVVLTAPTIQLDDFKLGDWSPEKKQATKAPAKSKVELRQQMTQSSEEAQKMLSPEVLRRQNAYLTVRVNQVISGKDRLGNGTVTAQLEQGRADIDTRVDTPGGSAAMHLVYEPGEQDVAVSLRAAANHFDYGILARRLDPKSEMRGIFSFDVDVSGRAQYLSELFRYGKGKVDFAVWPENLKSGLLDMWAVNVLMALLPAIDSSNESKVNCAIGRFELKGGMLSDRGILIDTNRMRVTGKGGVDFAKEAIQLYVKPKAKTPQFLSLALPIEVSGNFDDFSVGVRAGDVLETVGQLSTSVIWVPLQMMFGKAIPADGLDVCTAVNFK